MLWWAVPAFLHCHVHQQPEIGLSGTLVAVTVYSIVRHLCRDCGLCPTKTCGKRASSKPARYKPLSGNTNGPTPLLFTRRDIHEFDNQKITKTRKPPPATPAVGAIPATTTAASPLLPQLPVPTLRHRLLLSFLY